MKKLSFIFGFVFAVTMTMAQTTSINQLNSNAIGAGENISNVTQSGANLVQIYQEQSITTNNGTGGSATLNANVEQSGETGNTVSITQTHTGQKNGGVWDLTATAKQEGGDGNAITQTQYLGGGDWGPMEFTAMQEGNSNAATQIGTNANNAEGTINQKVMSNTATQLWHDGAKNYGGGLGITIEQDGTGNTATQEFFSGTVYTSGVHNRGAASITQTGEGNTAYQSQQGAGNFQSLEQVGDQNYTSMTATGNYNDATVEQTQSGGEVYVVQKQDLTGEAAIDVITDGNVVLVAQDADGYINILQDGLRNIADVMQFVDGASSTITQTGMNNTSTVVQN